jgi:hypothetical protein
MTQPTTSVLVIGFEPSLLDFSSPDLAAFPDLTAARILQALAADQASLQALGYDVELCLIDLGETAETIVRERLRAKPYDCILIGAGVRTGASHFLLFERLINLLHSKAPQAKLCFNTNPADTAAAVQRWV